MHVCVCTYYYTRVIIYYNELVASPSVSPSLTRPYALADLTKSLYARSARKTSRWPTAVHLRRDTIS